MSDAVKSSAAKPTSAAQSPISRGERRRLATRGKLLAAALELIAHRGLNGVAINEITEAADVGFGSFYNHFASKEAIQSALIDELVGRVGESLDTLGESLTDPAEVLSASIRYCMGYATENPLWGRFLLRVSLSPEGFNNGVGARLFRDINIGMEQQRFTASDPLVALIAVGGTSLSGIRTCVELVDARTETHQMTQALATQFGVDVADLPSRIAEVILKMLGVPEDEAGDIATRALPAVSLSHD